LYLSCNMYNVILLVDIALFPNTVGLV